MSKKRYCLQCDDGTVLTRDKRDLLASYKARSCVVALVDGWHCPVCKECEFAGNEGVRYSAELDHFAAEIDAQEAAELARIRKKLKLTQQQAAHLTGGGKNAFSRYERGQAKPLPAVINLFRLLDNHPELIKEIPA